MEMKPGEPTPKEAKILICKLAASNPRPTNRAIRVKVESKFGVTLSDRTIRRICEREGLPTSTKPQPGISQQLSSQMELSGHWPNLRRTAEGISAQLFTSFPQMLGFPWFSSPNERLRFTNEGGGRSARLSIEEENLFKGLREHDPGDKAWVLLDEWKRGVGKIETGLNALCTWVMGQPEVRGRQWLSESELESEKSGLTEYFPRSLALEAAEVACGLHHNTDWESLGPNSRRNSWLLNLVRDGSSFVPVAVGLNGPTLDGIKEMHQKLLTRINSLKQPQAIRAEWLELEDIANELSLELDRISNLALFPGTCFLCAGL